MSNGKRKGHIGGAKFCKHTTATESASKIAKLANTFDEVTKISLGVITQTNSGQFGMKFLSINGGWTVSVRGSGTVQKLHVYTNDPTRTREKLEKKFSKNLH
ncbi:MAG: hypothetical protein WAV98_02430 [Minisyncoccia bacterium]